MAKAELKTKANEGSVMEFLNSVRDERQRAESFQVLELMKRVTGEEPKMWGSSIIGFGLQHMKYASGRELEWMLTGFSPRKANLTLYIMDGFDKYEQHLARLGKYKTGKSCLYVKSLADIDLKVLEKLLKDSIRHIKKARKSRGA